MSGQTELGPTFSLPQGGSGTAPAKAHAKPTPDQLTNRFMHHAPKGDQADRYVEIRAEILTTAIRCVELTPCCPEQTRALNALDEAMFLFNAAIARNE